MVEQDKRLACLLAAAREDFGGFAYSKYYLSYAYWSHTPETDNEFKNIYFPKEVLDDMLKKNFLTKKRLWDS